MLVCFHTDPTDWTQVGAVAQLLPRVQQLLGDVLGHAVHSGGGHCS